MLAPPKAWKSFGLQLASLALGILLAGAGSVQADSDIFNKEKCINDFKSALSKVGKKRVDKVDLDTSCAMSAKSKINQINPDETRPELKIGDQQTIHVDADKACQASYEAAALVYQKLLEYRESVCREMLEKLDHYPDCLKNKPAAACQDDLHKMTSIVKRSKATMSTAVKNSITFLGKYEKLNHDAKVAYSSDKNELKNLRNSPEKMALPAAGPESGISQAVSAIDQGFPTLQEYLDNLEASEVHSRSSISLITEQSKAESFLQGMEKNLKQFDSSQFAVDLQRFTEKINNAKDDNNSLTKTWVPLGGTAASVLGNTHTGGGTTSSLTGGSGALPAIAALGAGAAIAGVANKSGGSSAPAAPAASPAPAAPSPTDIAANDGGATPAATYEPAPVIPAAEGDGTEKNDGNGDGTSSGPLAAAGGSLLLPTGGESQPQKKEAGKTETSRAPSSNSEEALQSFDGNLKNTPRPTTNSPSNSGNEISNLLGKMKDLFNFDDTTPSDGSNLMAGSGPGGPGGSAPGSSPDAYYEDSGDDTYTGEDEAYEESGYETGSGGEYSSQFGNVDTSLFERVHDRHLKCLQKGLVALTREELPE